MFVFYTFINNEVREEIIVIDTLQKKIIIGEQSEVGIEMESKKVRFKGNTQFICVLKMVCKNYVKHIGLVFIPVSLFV